MASLQSTLYESAGGALQHEKLSYLLLMKPRLFAADFNSDGVVDVNLLGKEYGR